MCQYLGDRFIQVQPGLVLALLALWNSLSSTLRLPVSPSVFKKHLMLHVISLRCYVKP